MLLGILDAKGVLSLAFKSVHLVGDLLTQQLDELEREAEDKGSVGDVLAAHFARVYQVCLPRTMTTVWAA